MNNDISLLMPKELIQAEKLMKEGRYEEALSITNNFEELQNLSSFNQFSCYLLKSSILIYMSNYKESLKFAEKAYQISQELDNDLQTINALLNMCWSLSMLFNFDKAFNLFKQCEDLLHNSNQISNLEYDKIVASINFIKAIIYYFQANTDQGLACAHKSLDLREKISDNMTIAESLLIIGMLYSFLKTDLDLALHYAERCQTLAEELNHEYVITYNLGSLGAIYALKGELKQSLNYYTQALALAEIRDDKRFIMTTLNNISCVYVQKGDLDKALKMFEKCLKFGNEFKHIMNISNVISGIIEVYILKQDIEKAQNYIEQLAQINEQVDNKTIERIYLLSKALILKASPRIHNRVKAQEILRQIIEEEIDVGEITIKALLNLCELLLEELRMTNELEVLDELEPVVSQLLNIAEDSKSYWVLAETYTLQAKLALVTLDIRGARRLLTKAQQIAEQKGMHLLAGKISLEHDNLLKELNSWKNMNMNDVTLNKRMELARIDDQMKSLIWKQDLSSLEYTDEDPIVFLILDEGGVTIFSHIFSQDWDFQDDLVGGFLSAINSFSGELFSEGLDRANFGQHTVLMKPFSSFSVCYLFKGQSYLANKKIKKFIVTIETNEHLKEIFENYYKNYQEIKLTENPPLEELFTNIFIHKMH
ncbi:MAG: tetratricopeptide repeat protein [Promethearchaeota archaeon]